MKSTRTTISNIYNLICLNFWLLLIISSLDGRSLVATCKDKCLFVPFLFDDFLPALTGLMILRKMYLTYSQFFSSLNDLATNRLFSLEYAILNIGLIPPPHQYCSAKKMNQNLEIIQLK